MQVEVMLNCEKCGTETPHSCVEDECFQCNKCGNRELFSTPDLRDARIGSVEIKLYLDNSLELYVNGVRPLDDVKERDMKIGILNIESVRQYLLDRGWTQSQINKIRESLHF
jgi:hypothetical protein